MEALDWFAATPVAAALKGSARLYLVVNAAHVLAIGLVVGAIVPLDLRLAGVIRSAPIAAVGPLLSCTAAAGVVLAVLTGLCLFSVRPQEYAQNPAFLAKVSLVALGVANALVLHRLGGWRRALATGAVTPALRVQALLSLVLWIGAVLAGRWIAFI
ncbi:DUF2214 domain-containing protein [Shinella sp. BYT-45]|uniref:DUF2214 domain-containing protein n=1 Tax=Shinella sp. BYT-45 TaxID=3377377 RepID=UPI00397F87CC